jgi:hypothetical protein
MPVALLVYCWFSPNVTVRLGVVLNCSAETVGSMTLSLASFCHSLSLLTLGAVLVGSIFLVIGYVLYLVPGPKDYRK